MPRSFGQITTTAQTEVPVYGQTYTEPTGNAQRSLSSSNAADLDPTGPGARQVKITYFDIGGTGGTGIFGPFTETVKLFGVTAVNTVATNIGLIEKMEVIAAGGSGAAVGALSLYQATGATGTPITTIPTGAIKTQLAHHYVPNKTQTRITDMAVVGTSGSLMSLKKYNYGGPSAAVEHPIRNPVMCNGAETQVVYPEAAHLPVIGPARVRFMVTPAGTASQTSYADMGWVDQKDDVT